MVFCLASVCVPLVAGRRYPPRMTSRTGLIFSQCRCQCWLRRAPLPPSPTSVSQSSRWYRLDVTSTISSPVGRVSFAGDVMYVSNSPFFFWKVSIYIPFEKKSWCAAELALVNRDACKIKSRMVEKKGIQRLLRYSPPHHLVLHFGFFFRPLLGRKGTVSLHCVTLWRLTSTCIEHYRAEMAVMTLL